MGAPVAEAGSDDLEKKYPSAPPPKPVGGDAGPKDPPGTAQSAETAQSAAPGGSPGASQNQTVVETQKGPSENQASAAVAEASVDLEDPGEATFGKILKGDTEGIARAKASKAAYERNKIAEWQKNANAVQASYDANSKWGSETVGNREARVASEIFGADLSSGDSKFGTSTLENQIPVRTDGEGRDLTVGGRMSAMTKDVGGYRYWVDMRTGTVTELGKSEDFREVSSAPQQSQPQYPRIDYRATAQAAVAAQNRQTPSASASLQNALVASGGSTTAQPSGGLPYQTPGGGFADATKVAEANAAAANAEAKHRADVAHEQYVFDRNQAAQRERDDRIRAQNKADAEERRQKDMEDYKKKLELQKEASRRTSAGYRPARPKTYNQKVTVNVKNGIASITRNSYSLPYWQRGKIKVASMTSATPGISAFAKTEAKDVYLDRWNPWDRVTF